MTHRKLPRRHQDRHESSTSFGELIFDARRLLAEVSPLNKTVILQLSQVLRERGGPIAPAEMHRVLSVFVQ